MQAELSPFERNFQDLLRQAARLGASDLHIEVFEDHARIRARVDGVLRVIQEVRQRSYIDRLSQQAKRLCRFDMGKLDVPQDSRFRAAEIPFDLRASLIPTLYGEKIVLRFLERDRKFSLADYPLPAAAKATLKTTLERWQGLVLVSGPTGSGKTTLLYSALAAIDPIQNNIHTLEDPVEYTLPGIVQTPMAGLSFDQALAALMRQDPDVILVGEIRDRPTAEAALHAASTGHLVLSTVHANSAADCVERLEGLGVSRELVLSNLLFASAQRLVPRNCPACLAPDASGRDRLKETFGLELTPSRSVGCDSCLGTGIRGRRLLFECLVRPRAELKLTALGSLREAALEALREGEIDAANACALA